MVLIYTLSICFTSRARIPPRSFSSFCNVYHHYLYDSTSRRISIATLQRLTSSDIRMQRFPHGRLPPRQGVAVSDRDKRLVADLSKSLAKPKPKPKPKPKKRKKKRKRPNPTFRQTPLSFHPSRDKGVPVPAPRTVRQRLASRFGMDPPSSSRAVVPKQVIRTPELEIRTCWRCGRANAINRSACRGCKLDLDPRKSLDRRLKTVSKPKIPSIDLTKDDQGWRSKKPKPLQRERMVRGFLDQLNAGDLQPIEDPTHLTISLLKHQRLGVAWMVRQEKAHTHGGVLADDMGLGKTVQTIALVLLRRRMAPNPVETPEVPASTSTLILVPLAILSQWKDEIYEKTDNYLSVQVHHGPSRTKTARTFTSDIVLSTLGIVRSEWNAKQLDKPAPLFAKSWMRVVIDESQNIKNPASKTAEAACQLQARFRWCLSGTPIQNDLFDLFSLFKFLRLSPFNERRMFKKLCKATMTAYDSIARASFDKLKRALKIVMLRRTKEQELKLPPKIVTVVYGRMSGYQKNVYDLVEANAKLEFRSAVAAGVGGIQLYSTLLAMLCRLRQVCCHPFLHPSIIDHGRTLWQKVGGNVAEFRDEWTDVQLSEVGEPTWTPAQRARAQSAVSALSSSIQQRLANEPNLLHQPCAICEDVDDTSDMLVMPCCCRVMCRNDVEARCRVAGTMECPACRTPVSEHVQWVSVQELRWVLGPSQPVSRNVDTTGMPPLEDPASPAVNVVSDPPPASDPQEEARRQQLRDEAAASARQHQPWFDRHAARVYAPETAFTAGDPKPVTKTVDDLPLLMAGKVSALLCILDQLSQCAPGSKTIVFSNFVRALDVLHRPLDKARIGFVQYDGSMKDAARCDALHALRTRPEVTVMLASMRCCSYGLNLTCCSNVVLLDPWWNPATGEQAIDRVHRFGQTSVVRVFHLALKDTIDERILDLQDRKRRLAKAALETGKVDNLNRLSMDDFYFLFDVKR